MNNGWVRNDRKDGINSKLRSPYMFDEAFTTDICSMMQRYGSNLNRN